MLKIFVSVSICLLLGLQVSACGKKSDPILRDDDGKVVRGHSFPPPYGAQVQE